MANPWLTSDDLIESIQRKIAVPLSQVTFTSDDLLAFCNEEMMISQVPSVLLYHEEFFVHQITVPLVTGISRYPIPDRAIGMRLRDVKWMDNAGNMFDMTRVAPEDKAFFQLNIGANQAIHKFYVEGNEIVLTPAVVSSPTGSLIMSFFLRPNQLVQNAKSATVVGINQTVTTTASLLNNGDNLQIFDQVYQNITVVPMPPVQPPGLDIFTAVGQRITAISVANPTQITSANHGLNNGQTITITNSNSTPSVNGSYTVTVVDANNFTIPVDVTIAGSQGLFTANNVISNITFYSTGQAQIETVAQNNYLSVNQTVTITGSNCSPSIDGTYQIIGILGNNSFLIYANVDPSAPGTAGVYTCPNQFQIGLTDTATATNLVNSVNNIVALGASINLLNASLSSPNTVLLLFSDIWSQFTTNCLNPTAITVPTETIGIQFNAVPSTYTDPDTMQTVPFFQQYTLVDFLQTDPGHQTYVYDVEIPFNGISGNSIFFPQNSLMVPSGQILNIGGGPMTDEGPGAISYVFAHIEIGDYMCLANEAIIPQIPPDLHSGLAERACARILASLGDQAGLQMSQSKIDEIGSSQGSLLDNRVEGTPQKITARHSLLRYGKMGTRRRT